MTQGTVSNTRPSSGVGLLRPLSGRAAAGVVGVLAIAMSLFHLYTGGMGAFTAPIQRGVHLSFAMSLIFLLTTGLKKDEPKEGVSLWNLLLAALSILPGAYLALYYEEIAERGGMVTDGEVWLGGLTILLLLEAVRRIVGWPLLLIAISALLYAFFGPYLPGVLQHRGYSLARISSQMFLSESGIMGIPLGVCSTIIALFILFGSFLEQSGGAKYFIELSQSLTRRSRGGPAKCAIVASGLMGTISGSAVANVVTTGNLTIPLMIRTGYSKTFAGAVEAVASSGGQLAPPVMGAAAFLMADMTGISYGRIALGALLPALLYYVSLYLVVHFEASRLQLRPVETRQGKPENCAHMFVPVIILIVLLSLEYSPTYVGFWTIVGMTGVSWLRPATRLTGRKILAALEDGAKSMLPVSAACACAGIVVGAVTLTGLPIKFSSLLIHFSGGMLGLLLVLTMITSIVLGMGLPTAPAYILLATLVGPALTNMGIPLLAAHMFIFYFGVVSSITPPVALAAYAASGISGAKPNETGFKACWIGLVTFIIPYMFVYDPALVGMGSWAEIGTAAVMSGIGVFALAIAITGHWLKPCSRPERLLFGCGAVLTLHPEPVSSAVGMALLITASALHLFRKGSLNRS